MSEAEEIYLRPEKSPLTRGSRKSQADTVPFCKFFLAILDKTF